jgi:hypothetical protein
LPCGNARVASRCRSISVLVGSFQLAVAILAARLRLRFRTLLKRVLVDVAAAHAVAVERVRGGMVRRPVVTSSEPHFRFLAVRMLRESMPKLRQGLRPGIAGQIRVGVCKSAGKFSLDKL